LTLIIRECNIETIRGIKFSDKELRIKCAKGSLFCNTKTYKGGILFLQTNNKQANYYKSSSIYNNELS